MGAAIQSLSEEERWRHLVEEHGAYSSGLKPPVMALTFLRAWGSVSAPVLVSAADGHQYVVKGRHNGRMIVNDQLIGLLGCALGAPVGEVALVNVPDQLVVAEPCMAHLSPGVCHGSRFVPGCSDDREEIQPVDMDANRARFAGLAVLYGWICASDHQVIYRKSSPKLVYSVDHGHFFPGGPQWTAASLVGAGPASPDPIIMSRCGLNPADLSNARERLVVITDEVIAEAIAAIPADWDFPTDDRAAMGKYLAGRRDGILAQIPAA